MAVHLSTSVTDLPNIGTSAGKDLKNMGIVSVEDLLNYFPFRYDDFSYQPPIAKLRHDDIVTITGRVRTIEMRPAKRRGLLITEAIVEDESGSIKVIWFNQPYLTKMMRSGQSVSLAGRIDVRFGRALMNPIWEPAGTHVLTGRIVPVYGLSGSLTTRRLRMAMHTALTAVHECKEWLPEDICATEKFPSLSEALTTIHFPENNDRLTQAIERLKFDELFLHQLLFADIRRAREKRPAKPFPIDEAFLKSFVSKLPFTLTSAQRRAAWEIIQDAAKPHPMNRLLEGDVGSGKTVVAALAVAHVLHAGASALYLAPTEILAVQQHHALQRFIPNVPIGLFTQGKMQVGERDVPREELVLSLKAGSLRFVIGTHALLQEGVEMPDLGFVVIDEQHRFGVEQRHALLDRGAMAPHLLSMTATPIPRSLALSVYGDLELSILNERPKGRITIQTSLVEEKKKPVMWREVLEEIHAGRRVYVVCPLIDPSDKLGSQSVKETADSLRRGALRKTRIGTLHGRMKSEEKTTILEQFRSGACDVLVSTTVVEVGVDVPDATVMVVIGAERFGLAQLHQLRGRVGRSTLPSRCYLVPDTLTKQGRARLEAVVTCTDGFQLAEKDLELRGPGNVFGNAQSGFPDFQLATPADVPLMKKARDSATRLFTDDPNLDRHPSLLDRMHRSIDRLHLE